MKSFPRIAIVLSLLTSLSTLAAPSTPHDTAPDESNLTASPSNDRNHDESWYWGFALGAGSLSYSGAGNKDASDTLKASSNVDHSTVYLDLRFLWPVADGQTAIGVCGSAIADHYENKYDSSYSLDATYSLLAFEAQHYFTGNIGDGFYASGDIGLVTANAKIDLGSTTTTSETKSGIGVRVGVGYSILLSNETRLPIQVQYQYASVTDDNSASSVIGSVGVLF
jgi:hypothetical protein